MRADVSVHENNFKRPQRVRNLNNGHRLTASNPLRLLKDGFKVYETEALNPPERPQIL